MPNLSGIDLNLLNVLDALLREQHVGRAADRVGLSQPAASHALRRLRDLFGDPLLVQVGRRMTPTPRAESLRAPLALILGEVKGLFADPVFDPATSPHVFRIMAPDLALEQVAPRLLARAVAAAPAIGIEFKPWRGTETLTEEYLSCLDLIVAGRNGRLAGFEAELLYTDCDALAVRADRPDAEALGTIHGFLAARHVAVVGSGEREDILDPWLRDVGLARDVGVVAPSYIMALRLAARSDLVAFIPRRLI